MRVRSELTHAFRLFKSTGLGLLAALALSTSGGSVASAAVTPASLDELPVVDTLTAFANPLTTDGNWTQLASVSHPGLISGTAGWSPYYAFPRVHGAFWNAARLDATDGVAVAATLSGSPDIADRHFSLWLDIPDGATSGQAGYELRFVQTAIVNTYDVTVVRWQSGSGTVLAFASGQTLPPGASFALADGGDTVSAWTDVGSGYTPLLTATDSSFDSGYAGISAAGNIVRIRQFKAGSLDGSPPAPTPSGEATLKASYRFQGSLTADPVTAPALTDIGVGSSFANENVEGEARQVLAFPLGGGLDLATSGLVDAGNHSVAMVFRLAEVSGYRRILDFSGGTSDTGLYNLGGRVVLYPVAASAPAVLASSYVHLVFTSKSAGTSAYDSSVYVEGTRVVSARTSQGYGLGAGALRFFKDNTSGPYPGEESAGSLACAQVYDGTLTAGEVAQLAAQPSRCEPLPASPDPDPDPNPPDPKPTPQPPDSGAPAPSAAQPGLGAPTPGTVTRTEQAHASATRRPRAKRWRGALLVDTGLTVSCSAGTPCVANGQMHAAPTFGWLSVGSVRLAVPAGTRRKVVIRLSPRGRRVLREAGKLRVRASASITTAGGTTATSRQSGRIAFPQP